MRTAVHVMLTAVVATSCLRSTAFRCLDNIDCGAAGVCEAIGYCSVANPACAGTGRSFSDSAGRPVANACVPAGGPGTDAGVDATTDAGVDAPTDAGVDAPIDATPPVECPADYAPIAGSAHSYKAIGSSSWGHAANECKTASPRAYLAVPGDVTELMNLATIAPVPFWIGLDDQAIEGEFVTQNGDPATFLPWQSGAPGPPSERCVRVISSTEIETAVCGTTHVAICECDR
jgi:hypothetical protein